MSRLAERADYAGFALSTGGALARQESNVAFAAPDGRAQLLGAYLARGHQHIDHTTRIDHAHPGCATEEISRACSTTTAAASSRA